MPLIPFRKRENTQVTQNDDIRYLESILRYWLYSDDRAEQLLGDAYYEGDQAILRREKQVIGQDGQLVTIDNVINNKIVDNQYRKLVDQKTNYALGRPFTIATDNDEYAKALRKVFNKKMHRQIRKLAQYSVNGGIAYMYPYYGTDGSFKTMIFPGYEILPEWLDKDHTELKSAIRYYPEPVFAMNGSVDYVYRVEHFTMTGIDYYVYKGGSLLADKPHADYVNMGDRGYNWNKLPIIPFKYNANEIPLIRDTKSLQDALNAAMSDFQNNMQEDPRTSIIVLKNYDGTNLAEFRQNLATYGVIKVTTVDGVQGGVETLKVEPNAQSYQANLMQIKRALIENGRGFDAKEERMDGDPNQMNIESMYTDIDLDVDGMEAEFQAGFENLIWFINQYLIQSGQGDFTAEDVDFIFNRDIFINEDAKINSCVQSLQVLSKESVVEQHPWTKNALKEMERLEKQKQEELDEMEAMQDISMKAKSQEPTKQNNLYVDRRKSS